MVDKSLLDRSIRYHGPSLVTRLSNTQPKLLPPNVNNQMLQGSGKKTSQNEEDYEKNFEKFIAQKAQFLFQNKSKFSVTYDTLIDDDKESDKYSIMPPIENFMDIPPEDRKVHLLRSLEQGDVVCGVVSMIQDTGISITLLCIQRGPVRDLTHIRLTAFCPVRELPRMGAHDNPISQFSIKDTVRAVIIHIADEKVTLSMNYKQLKEEHSDLFLGSITHEDLPVHFKRLLEPKSGNFVDQIKNDPGFSNITSTQLLTEALGIEFKTCHSFLNEFHGKSIKDEESGEYLRQIQSRKFASISVARGIDDFHAKNITEALQHFNKALQIDPENADAFVARGALFANKDNYTKAFEDFEKALKFSPNHKNAKKYLVETKLDYADSLIKKNKVQDAKDVLEKTLDIAPYCLEARKMMDELLREVSPGTLSRKRKTKERNTSSMEKSNLDDEKSKNQEDIDDRIRFLVSNDKKLQKGSDSSSSSEDSSKKKCSTSSYRKISNNSDDEYEARKSSKKLRKHSEMHTTMKKEERSLSHHRRHSDGANLKSQSQSKRSRNSSDRSSSSSDISYKRTRNKSAKSHKSSKYHRRSRSHSPYNRHNSSLGRRSSTKGNKQKRNSSKDNKKRDSKYMSPDRSRNRYSSESPSKEEQSRFKHHSSKKYDIKQSDETRHEEERKPALSKNEKEELEGLHNFLNDLRKNAKKGK